MKKLALASLILTAALCTQAFTCSSSAYHSAVVAEHDFSTALQSFQQAELAEHTNGRIDLAEHQRIEAGIGQVATAAQVLVTALQTSGSANATVQSDFTAVGNALNSLVVDGVFSVKNAQSQNLLATLVRSIQAILQNVGSILAVQTVTPITKVGN